MRRIGEEAGEMDHYCHEVHTPKDLPPTIDRKQINCLINLKPCLSSDTSVHDGLFVRVVPPTCLHFSNTVLSSLTAYSLLCSSS